jgi:hypothetical protein
MLCPHCGFSCTSKGRDITFSSFKSAIYLCNKIRIGQITIGGGEPTIHLLFFDILQYSLDNFRGLIGIITNGKDSFSALKLLDIYKKHKGKLFIGLSKDDYHEPICDYVYSEYKKYGLIHRFGHISNIGRAKKLLKKDEKVDKKCFSPPIITPNGNVKQCACGNAPVLINVSKDNRRNLENLRNIFKEGWCVNAYV